MVFTTVSSLFFAEIPEATSATSAAYHFVESLEINLNILALLLEIVLEMLAILCIFIGIVSSCRLGWYYFTHGVVSRYRHRPYVRMRARFGRALALALEFQLGADVLSTTVAPTFESLGRLGAIAVIRTFLNYFLAKELEGLEKLEKPLKKEPV